MLNFKKFSRIGFIVTAISIAGCKDKDVNPSTPAKTTDNASQQAINSWVYEVMNDVYFWYKYMPSESSLDSKLNPKDYFEKLIYQRTTTDRFSNITDDIDALTKEFNGVSKIFGINYTLSFTDDSQTKLAAFLSYVVKGSPAETAGLKRGDIIMKVNGTQLTPGNYTTLFGSGEAATFTLGMLNGNTLISDNTKTISVTKAEVSEDPVLFSSVINKTAYGKTIGYLVYTQFIPGTAVNADQYDNELRQVFAHFKSQGVNELVVDLRFNPGGYISSAKTLASLIGKNVSSTKIFYKEQWNDKYLTYWQNRYGSNSLNYPFLDEGSNIGSRLNRVFILTSNGTASASELVINGLRPYMDVITIGEHTYGKNLFGSLVPDDQNRWKWGIYVMLGQTANVNDQSDYGTVKGIPATYEVKDVIIPYKPFGDENETLLRKALDVIGIPAPTGTRLTATKQVQIFISETLKDNAIVREKRMIKNQPTFNEIK
jgi:carboxyl-terminal processing protease